MSKMDSGQEENIEKIAVDCLLKNGYNITTAESCTGGLLSAALVNVAGVSDVFKEGYITYSNEAKQKLLGVEEELLNKYGAVSQAVAESMARGAAQAAGAQAALSTTGIAGPDGGTEEKPVGLVYIGCYLNGTVRVIKNLFQGSRMEIREKTVKEALTLLLQCLEER